MISFERVADFFVAAEREQESRASGAGTPRQIFESAVTRQARFAFEEVRYVRTVGVLIQLQIRPTGGWRHNKSKENNHTTPQLTRVNCNKLLINMLGDPLTVTVVGG